MDTTGGRTAIVVPFRLPESLETLRVRHVDNAHLGVPAHVTLLFPFVPARRLDAAVVEQAAATVGRRPGFDVEFREARTFAAGPTEGGAVWLAPEPPGPFVELINALAIAFPEYPPYEGLHETVIPHLTLANVDVDVDALVAAASVELPFRRRVNAAALLVEDAAGLWRIQRDLPLR